MMKRHILERMTHDIQALLQAGDEMVEGNIVRLWDENGTVQNATSYGKEAET